MEDLEAYVRSNPNWVVSFVHKEGNGVAHSLAKLGLSINLEHVWVENFPSIISHVVSSNSSY